MTIAVRTCVRGIAAVGCALALAALCSLPFGNMAFGDETQDSTSSNAADAEPVAAAKISNSKVLLYKAKKYVANKGKANSKAVSGIQIKLDAGGYSGGMNYTFKTAKKTFKATKSNAKAGNKKQKGRYFTVKLTGDLASNYNVYYCAYVKGYGQMGWAKNGAKAGTANLDLIGYQVKLVAKDAAQPNTDRQAFSAKSGFVNKVTGTAKLDKSIKAIAKANKYKLMKCAQWAAKITYSSTGRSPVSSGTMKSSRLLTEAKAAFASTKASKNAGDCYTHTAAFYCLATYLGYNAKAIAGTYTNAAGNSQDYSWVTVKTGNEQHIWDTTNATHTDGSSRLDIAPDNPLYGFFA